MLDSEYEHDIEAFTKDPNLRNTFDWYDLSREEQMELQYKRVNSLAKVDRKRYLDNFDTMSPYAYLSNIQGLVSFNRVTSQDAQWPKPNNVCKLPGAIHNR